MASRSFVSRMASVDTTCTFCRAAHVDLPEPGAPMVTASLLIQTSWMMLDNTSSRLIETAPAIEAHAADCRGCGFTDALGGRGCRPGQCDGSDTAIRRASHGRAIGYHSACQRRWHIAYMLPAGCRDGHLGVVVAHFENAYCLGVGGMLSLEFRACPARPVRKCTKKTKAFVC